MTNYTKPDPSAAYHIGLSDEERASIELQSFNFHEATGYKMKIPPKLFDDLHRGGVNMRHIEADPALEQ